MYLDDDNDDNVDDDNNDEECKEFDSMTCLKAPLFMTIGCLYQKNKRRSNNPDFLYCVL